MQLGYYALDQAEPMEARLSRVEGYLPGFTGRAARREEVGAFRAWIASLAR